MSRLSLRLFGPGTLTFGGVAVRPHSARTLALLAFLVIEPGRAHPRSRLVDLLWPGAPEAAGRQGLRQALYSLRTVAGGRLRACLQVDPAWVRFDWPAQDAAVDIDVRQFLAGVRSTAELQWCEASQRYQAPLLDGARLRVGAAFDDWLAAAREHLHALAMQNLGRLTVARMARSQWEQASGSAQTMCRLDPTSELASRHLMTCLAEQGDTPGLDSEWLRLQHQLSQVLGVEPSAESLALHRRLRARGHAPAGPSTAPRPAGPPGAAGHAGQAPAASEVEAIVRAGQAAERVYAFHQAADLYDRALKLMQAGVPRSTQRLVDLLLRKEAVLERLGRRTDQAGAIDEAMAIAEALGDMPRVAATLLRRAGLCTYLGQHPSAQHAAERALRIFCDIDDLPGQAEALRELGFVHWHAGDPAQALRQGREVLALHRRMGDIAGEATALHNLAEIHRGLGSPRQAGHWFEQALQLHWATRNPGGEILSLFGWATSLRQAGDLSGAMQKYEAALRLSEGHGERAMHSRALHAMSLQHAAQGGLDAALDFMERAIEVDRSIGYAHALGHDLVDLADLHGRRGEMTQARVALQEARVWYGFTEDRDAEASTLARLADLDAGPAGPGRSNPPWVGIKSHLPLSEGKVYCEFESPARRPAPD